MSNKQAIKYVIVRQGWTPYGGFEVFKITSENKGMIFGSFVSGHSRGNKIAQRDIIFKFDTVEQAIEKLENVKEIWEIYEIQIKEFDVKIREIRNLRERQIKFLCEKI